MKRSLVVSIIANIVLLSLLLLGTTKEEDGSLPQLPQEGGTASGALLGSACDPHDWQLQASQVSLQCYGFTDPNEGRVTGVWIHPQGDEANAFDPSESFYRGILTSGWKVYTSEDESFSFKFPANWKVYDYWLKDAPRVGDGRYVGLEWKGSSDGESFFFYKMPRVNLDSYLSDLMAVPRSEKKEWMDSNVTVIKEHPASSMLPTRTHYFLPAKDFVMHAVVDRPSLSGQQGVFKDAVLSTIISSAILKETATY